MLCEWLYDLCTLLCNGIVIVYWNGYTWYRGNLATPSYQLTILLIEVNGNKNAYFIFVFDIVTWKCGGN